MRRYAKIDSTYEVVRATCPWCDHPNVFNRRSDLQDFAPISFREVTCESDACLKLFAINGDTVGPAYRSLYYEGYEFLRQKRYGLVIVSTVQSLEMFFAFALYELWLSRRLLRRTRQQGDLEQFNEAVELLYEKTKKFSYLEMRDLFFAAITEKKPKSVAEGRLRIEAIPKKVTTPSDNEFDALPTTLRALVLELKRAKVHELRNQVIHKRAYRPTKAEAEDAMREIGDILIPLSNRLRLDIESF